MAKKYPKPDWIPQEQWDEYLKTIEDFGKSFVENIVPVLKKATENIKKLKNIELDDLELIQDKEENEERKG